MRIFISAGEVSGDIVAARLIGELRAADPTVAIDGIGGSRMAAAGARLIASTNHLGVVGFSEGVVRVPSAVRTFLAVMRHCHNHRPDVVVLIANDVFNVVLGRRLRARGIRTIAFFPPQTWIWKALAPVIAPSLDMVLASFPEEVSCYADAGVSTEFVGHYLADVLTPLTVDEKHQARRSLQLSPSDTVVAILPGSRREEVARLGPVLLSAADLIRRRQPHIKLVTACAADNAKPLRTPDGQPLLHAIDSHLAMRAADVVLVCSGTATLEASLIGVPMVVAYRSSWLTYGIVRAAIGVGLLPGETVAIPNLLLGRPVVQEFVQKRLSAPALARAVLSLITDDGLRRSMVSALSEVRTRVERRGTLPRAARLVLQQVSR